MKKLIPIVALAFITMSSDSIAQAPVISYSGSNDVCFSCVTLNVTNPQPNFSYSWFVGNYACGIATGSVNYGSGTTIQACGTGEYYCVGTNPNGVQYTSNPLVIRTLPGSIGSSLLPKPYHTDPVVCMDSVQLCIPSVFYASFPNTTFTWYKNGVAIPGANGSSYLATTNGNYTYSVTSSCTTALSSGVDIFPVPLDPQITSVTPVPVCTQDTAVFQIVNPQPNYFYEWQRFFQGTSYLTIGYGTSVSYPVISNAYDTLKVRVKQTAIGCIKYSDDYIVPLQNNNPTITPNGTIAICGGTSKTLTGYPGSTNPGYTYQWYKNGNPLSGAVFATYNATTAGSYTVATTTTCGTNVSVATVITVLPAPTVTISAGGPTTFCKPDSVKLSSTVNGTGPFTYQWKNYGANILGALSANYMVGKTGKYKLRVTDANGCGRTSNQIDVTANPLPVASITANGPTIFCSGDSVVLSAAQVAGQTYQWKRYSNLINGATSTNYTVKFAGKYRCVVTNTFGCTRTSNTLDVFVPCREAATPEDGLPYLHASVYPNPTSENFTLSLTASEAGTAQIRVFDMTGRLMQPDIVPTGEAQFEISGLQSGIYIAEITMNGIRETVRLIKTN